MRFKFICLSAMLIYGLYVNNLWAEAVLTSKAYVDNKVPGYNSSTESQSLLADTTTTGTIAKRAIYSDTAANYDSSTQNTYIPTMGAVMSAISSGVSTNTLTFGATETTAANAYSTTFDDSTGNWPTADGLKLVNGTALGTALSLKQNKITTGLAPWDYGNGTASPTFTSLVSYSTTDGITGNSIGIWDEFDAANDLPSIAGDIMWNYYNTQSRRYMIRNSVPNVYSVVHAFRMMFPANNSTTYPNGSLVTYDTAGDPGTKKIVTTVASGGTDIPTDGAVYSAVDAKQDKITGHASGVADSLLTDSQTTGTVQKRAIFNDTAANYDSTTQNTYIPTMGAVMSAISSGVSAGLPTGTAGDVVTYDANGAIGGSLEVFEYDDDDHWAPLMDYSTTFTNTLVNDGWPEADATKLVDMTGLVNLLADKQNVLDPNNTTTHPNGSLVAYGTTSGNPGRKKIVTTVASGGTDIPTDGAVYSAVDAKQSKIPASTNGYLATHSGTEGTFGTPVDPATFQSAITAHAANAADSLLTDSTTTGTVQKRAIFNDTAANYDSTTQSTQIPTMGAVMSAVSSGVSAGLPTGPSGSIATYQAGANNTGVIGGSVRVVDGIGNDPAGVTIPNTGAVVSAFHTKFPANGGTDKVVTLSSTAGAPSSRNIVTTLTSGGTDIPTDGAVYSAVNGKQDKATCTEYKAGSNNTICYAYTFADISAGSAQSKGTPEIEPELKKQ